VPVRWDAVMAAPVGEVALPSYPWQRRRHWLPDPAPTRARPQADPQTATPTELAAPPVPVAVEPEAPDVDALTLGVRERIAAAMDGADVDEVPADGPLEALGLDSIVLVELKNQLERDLGIRIPLQVLLEAATPRHLAEGVVAALRAHEVMT
jgi:acyl carrier protein